MSGEVLNANQSPPEIETDSRVERGSGPGVGALLHASRLRCGEDLRDVAQILRIRYVHLEAMEAGRFEDLPGPAYAIGFVRAYAKHLGLDADEVVKRFRAETTNIGEAPELSFPVPVPEGGIPGGAVAERAGSARLWSPRCYTGLDRSGRLTVMIRLTETPSGSAPDYVAQPSHLRHGL